MKSKRQTIRETQKRQQKIAKIITIVGGALLVIVIGYIMISSANAPAKPTPTIEPTMVAEKDMVGEAIPASGASDHIPENSDPGAYSSNPPSSGHHYPVWGNAGFYDQNVYGQYPQGRLVHNLEHGYIIFWYNCKILSESQCSDLKTQIKAVMKAEQDFKLIAYPWDSIDTPIVMTSWGYMLSFKTFDTTLARTFVAQHRNRAPEPNAP